ncbi:MAG: contractile injection system tape measure protein [Bacteroidota bacterium]
MDTHYVHRQIIELQVPDEASTGALREKAAALIEEAFVPAMEQAAKWVPSHQTLSLDTLEIDLGVLPPELTLEQTEERLRTQIEASLRAMASRASTSASENTAEELSAGAGGTAEDSPGNQAEEPWTMFLRTGLLPWEHADSPKATLARLFETQRSTPQTLKYLMREPNALRRVLAHFPAIQLLERWASGFSHPLPWQPLKALWEVLSASGPVPLRFWQALLSHGHTPGPVAERLRQWVVELQAVVPEAAWLTQPLPASWVPHFEDLEETPIQWADLLPPAATQSQGESGENPTRQQWDLWRQRWDELLQEDLVQASVLARLIQHLEAGQPLFRQTPWERSLADLRTLLQGRHRQRLRQEQGLTPRALVQLQALLVAYHTEQREEHALALLEMLLPLVPGLIDPALPDSWYDTLAEAWQISVDPNISPAQQGAAPQRDFLEAWALWLQGPRTSDFAEAAPEVWVSLPEAAQQALVAWQQHYLSPGTAFPVLPDFTTLKTLLAPATLHLGGNTPTSPAQQALLQWVQLYHFVPDAEVRLALQPEVHWLSRQLKEKRTEDAPIPTPREKSAAVEYYLQTGGLVLLWPFIRSLFSQVGLLQEGGKAFLSPESQARAVLLLYYLATGQTEAVEPELPLCKLLCQWPMEEPLPVQFTPTEQEEAQVQELLTSALRPSERLAASGPESFRGNFLVRDGVLRAPAPDWVLHVDPKPYDVLLSSLPWQWSMVRLPWMEGLLHVSWGAKPNPTP